MSFEQWAMAHEPHIRVAFFVGVFAAIAMWETARPRRTLRLSRAQRWRANMGLVALNTLVVRLLFPLAAVGVATLAAERGWGVFNVLTLPPWLSVLLAVVLMDGVIWLQHVMVHAIPALWRLHRVHHADLDYDLTTGARFHPIEIVLSMGVKFAAIVLLGAPALAVLVFEVLLSACAMFNHGNIRLPERVDRVLRWFIVTPDMHRVHHSVDTNESNRNFGFNLTWWDRLLGTYQERPLAGHEGMTIGILNHSDPDEVARLPGLLVLPFKAEVGDGTAHRGARPGDNASRS
ncbi:MAG: sterol desaturase family protein [Hydrogenophaga sp.]